MIFRDATRADVPAIVALLIDDPLGVRRENADITVYLRAFDEIAANPAHQLIVADDAGRIVATCQLTILSGLSRNGGRRALIEAVRTAADRRSTGIGARLMAECETRARAGGASILQLTTDTSRTRAHRFYQGLGYTASHVGYKKALT